MLSNTLCKLLPLTGTGRTLFANALDAVSATIAALARTT
jgi:hypothetical protein